MKTAQKTYEYRIGADLPGASTLREAVSLLGRLVEGPSFLDAWIPQILDEARQAEEWYVARRVDAADRSLSMQIFVWPPGTGTRIHDHAAWGALRPVVGSVLEKRYERLDDGSVHEHARLKQSWELTWTEEDGASTVLPYDGGIHSISNTGDRTAVTVHLYGPRQEIDGRDYDPSRDYVCDRYDEEPEPGPAGAGRGAW
ncbi:MAG TPA: cysteine dioxygenase family protein [Rubrobacter sp.]|nr:cysteine dioxygenase family protein [Rubrobacter sp.]